MALPRIGGDAPAPSQNQTATPTPAANPAPQASGAPTPPPPAPGRRPPPSRATLPPVDPSVTLGGGGGFEKRDEEYWETHPLRAGTYFFDLFVNKVIDWGVNGITVTFRVSAWDRDANRPTEHHGRDIDWPQHKRADMLARMNLPGEEGEKAKRGVGYHRRDLVTNYVSLGRPEETWIRDEAGNAVPPYYDFFVRRLADGICVPLIIKAKVVVQPKREKWPDFKDMRLATLADGTPIQAPMPFEVTPYTAEINGWRTTEERIIPVNAYTTKDGFHYEAFEVVLARVARDAVTLGHGGMPTYKDL